MAEWFAPKRYGWGSGLPIAWQGWLLSAVFVAIAVAVTSLFPDRPIVMASILLPAVLLYILIAARTTKGGWRWRWGGDE